MSNTYRRLPEYFTFHEVDDFNHHYIKRKDKKHHIIEVNDKMNFDFSRKNAYNKKHRNRKKYNFDEEIEN